MTANIYDAHDKAFANVSAWVILDAQGTKVATVAVKFPKDGASRLWAYVHWIGAHMERASASGYGYDKRTPAVISALLKANFDRPEQWDTPAELDDLKSKLDPHSGYGWERQISDAGYQVLQAV